MAEKQDDLVSMKRPRRQAMAMPMESEDEDSNWGLQIRLENAELDALKLALPQPGKEFKITAIGKVTQVVESKSKGNEGDRCVTIQITAMNLR